MPFNSLLSEKTARLTGAQQRALKYITENYEDAVFLTASSLSRRIGISKATIVRLAQALGFHGFRGMQRMLGSQSGGNYRFAVFSSRGLLPLSASG